MGFLTSALGGSLLGGILALVTRVTDVWAKKKEAEAEIMKAKALSELKIKEAELDAFKTSLSSQDEDFDPDPLPADSPKWAIILRAGAETLRVLCDAFRAFTRPGLTWAMVLALVLFIMAGKVGPEAIAAIIGDFVFTASTAVMWWFGSRPLARTSK
jgi:hypothetical protein